MAIKVTTAPVGGYCSADVYEWGASYTIDPLGGLDVKASSGGIHASYAPGSWVSVVCEPDTKTD